MYVKLESSSKNRESSFQEKADYSSHLRKFLLLRLMDETQRKSHLILSKYFPNRTVTYFMFQSQHRTRSLRVVQSQSWFNLNT